MSSLVESARRSVDQTLVHETLPGVLEIVFPRALVNAFVLEGETLTVIDTGTPGNVERIASALRKRGRSPEDIALIILTHRHADHAGNAAALAGRSGAEVHVSPIDAPYVRDGIDQPRPHVATPLGNALVPYVKAALPWRVGPVTVSESLHDGALVGPLRVISTPGHTPGHVSLLWEARGILFTADAAANITAVGPHPAADDPAQAQESFRRLAELNFDAACFGHGRTLRRGAAGRFASAA